MAQRYFLTAESTYEDLRQYLNTQLKYPNSLGKSIFQTALQAPRDNYRRILLAVDTSIANYAAVTAAIDPLLASDAMQEVDEATYLAAVSSATAGVATWDEISNKPSTFAPSAHKSSHATGGSDALTASDIGAAASSHTHGNLTNAGAIGTTSGLPVITTTSGVLTTGAFGASSGQFCQGNDSRLSDSRTPTSHASTHQIGGADFVANVVNSPSQITSNQNDYSLPSADVVRISSDAARDITGFAAGSSGQAVMLVNVGDYTIALRHQSTSSTAANRIVVPWASDYLMDAGYSALLVYDATASRWRIV